MASALLAVWVPNATPTVKVNVPGAEGKPLSAPVVEFSVIPPGNAPVAIDQVKAPFPPAAASVWL